MIRFSCIKHGLQLKQVLRRNIKQMVIRVPVCLNSIYVKNSFCELYVWCGQWDGIGPLQYQSLRIRRLLYRQDKRQSHAVKGD